MQKAGVGDFFTIYRSYKHDFPKSERKPFWMILQNVYHKKCSDILTLKEENKTVAYAITLKKSRYKAVLLDYLATLETGRSKGYGSRFLQGMKQFYAEKSGIFIEIEACGMGETKEENEIRERRKAFYLRNGFVMLPIHLVLFGIDMHVMYLPIQQQLPENPLETLKDLYVNHLGEKLTQRYITLTNI